MKGKTVQLVNGTNVKISDLKDWELKNYAIQHPHQRKEIVEERERRRRYDA